VGKSSIIARYVDGNYYHNLPSTIGIDYKVKRLSYEEKPIKLHIWDTAGQEKFRSITLNFYKGLDGVLLVFDLTDENSLNNIPHWIRQIKLYATENVALVLVGNKCDIEENRISKDKIDAICGEYSLKYFESSAKVNINIENAIMSLVGEILTFQGNNNNNNNADNKENNNLVEQGGEIEKKRKKGAKLAAKPEDDNSDLSQCQC
jgi:Ras-related protein Rab-8A